MAAAAGAIVLSLAFFLSTRVPSVAAASNRKGDLHVTKNCAQNTGAPGSYCTITSSNFAEIKPGARVYYDQAFGVPTGFLDSSVILDIGTGDWAVGRCTVDATTARGICTFSDGTGQLAGFKARVDVSPFPNFVDYHWDGTYSFNSEDDR